MPVFTLRIDVYALRDLMGHCYVHFAFLFTLRCLWAEQTSKNDFYVWRLQTHGRHLTTILKLNVSSGAETLP